jgi:hypothetical protein
LVAIATFVAVVAYRMTVLGVFPEVLVRDGIKAFFVVIAIERIVSHATATIECEDEELSFSELPIHHALHRSSRSTA